MTVNRDVSYNGIVTCCFTLDDRLTAVYVDDGYYKLIGHKNILFPFTELLPQEDRQTFLDFIETDSCDQAVVLRVLMKDGFYRWMLLCKVKADRSIDNRRYLQMQLYDVMLGCSKFASRADTLDKYRAVFNQMRDKIFEYDFESGILKIFCYRNNRSEMIDKNTLDAWQEQAVRLGYVKDNQTQPFLDLCNAIRNGTDAFSYTFSSSLLSCGERVDLINFRGQVVRNGGRNVLSTGLITELSSGPRSTEKNVFYDSEENTKDPGTGLLNKKYVAESVKKAISLELGNPSGRTFYLMIADIDDFKVANDTYGHLFGDQVISTFATVMASNIGSRGIVGRIGGDEFMALLMDYSDIYEVRTMLKNIRSQTKLNLGNAEKDYSFSASIGVAAFPKDGESYERLFKVADTALYIAKGKGKNRFIIYDRQLHGEITEDGVTGRNPATGAAFMKPIEKFDLAASLLIRLGHKGSAAVQETLEELIDKFSIHGVALYAGAELHPVYMLGHYLHSDMQVDFVLGKEYRKLFDENQINTVNRIEVLERPFPKAYQELARNQICSTLQMLLLGENGSVQGLLEFDTFGTNRRKWSEDDIAVMHMVARAIGDALQNEK